LAAASFLGLGSIWAQGLSGSAALQMATPGALPPQIRDIVAHGGIVPGGIIPFRHTIFLWQSIASVLVEIVVVTTVMWLATTPAVWGVILQFPFYAGIAGIITTTHLNERIAGVFVRVSTAATFPAVVAVYSAALGVFVPSGGSKWVIEAPYVMEAAHSLKTHLGWVVSAYDLGEALANLIQPFWMLPILGLFRLGARDVMGYTIVVFLELTPVVLILVTLFGMTLPYPL